MGVDLQTGMKMSKYFQRVSTFFACSNIDPTCDTSDESVAEIVTASNDGKTLVYTDGPQEKIGFVDIAAPSQPKAAGTVDVGGEPTSVVACGLYAFVVVNTSPDFVNPSGIWHAVRISDQKVIRTGNLPGQPDSIAASPDCKVLAIAIENERDEDVMDGEIPQAPPGKLVTMDISSSDPTKWTLKTIELKGLDKGINVPQDPEPEFVSINKDYIAVLTLQENNGIVMINTKSGKIINSFSAGKVNLKNIDIVEDGIINQTSSLDAVPREPDGVAWIGTEYFATANEGDLNGGSRGFTIFRKNGEVVFDSGNTLELMAAKYGHYNDGRSDSKGIEPEGIVYAVFDGEPLLFILAERASLVFVYNVNDVKRPKFIQVLPAALSPEGAVTIPRRNLLAVASELDSREDGFRAGINIYYRGKKTSKASYALRLRCLVAAAQHSTFMR
jgi:hypothetical protein